MTPPSPVASLPTRLARRCAGPVSLGILALLPAGAIAAPTWLAPEDLSAPGQDASFPQVALDPAGNAVSVWARSNGANGVAQSAVRPAGPGSWQPPVDLSQPNQSGFVPRIAVDPAGNAVAVWSRFNGTNLMVQASVRPAATGAWQPPVDISQTGVDGAAPQVAVDPAGNAVAVWRRWTSGVDFVVQAAVRPAASGAWQPPVDLSKTGQTSVTPQIVIDPSGNAVAVWTTAVGGDNITQAAVRPAASGAWQPPVDLSQAGQDAFNPQVAVDPAGNAIATWHRSNGTHDVVQASARPAASGVWQPPVDISQAGQNAFDAQVAFDATGNAVAAWTRSNGTHDIVQASARPAASGVWQGALDISQAGQNAIVPRLALDPAGNAVVVWRRSNGTNDVVQAATRFTASGAWQPPVDLSQAGQNASLPEVALDPAGNAVVVWRRSDGQNDIVQAAALDAAGPVLDGLTGPGPGQVGQALAFSVAPRDAWSALGQTTWDFGDGTGATGTAVSHAYGAPGTYTATVTSADVLGNATSASLTVVVSAAPPPPPPPAPVTPDPPAAAAGAPAAPTSGTAVCAPVPERTTSDKGTIRLTKQALVVQQRIDAAALRRLNAANDWIDEGIVPADLCAGSFGQGAFAPGVPWAGGAAAQAMSAPTPRGLDVVKKDKRPATFTLSLRQVRINDRISRALLARAQATARRIESLTGGNLAPGASLRGRPLYAELTTDGPLPGTSDQPATSLAIGPLPAAGTLRLSAAQLRKTQQRSQRAIVLANRVNDRIQAGLTEDQFTPGSIGAGRLTG